MTSSEQVRFFQTDHLEVGLGSRAARGGAVTVLAQGLKFVVSTAGTITLARLLTPEDYGLVGMTALLIGVVSLFRDLGLSNAIVQSKQLGAAQVSTLFWINLAAGVVLLLITWALAPAVAWFYGDRRLILITIFSAFGLLFGTLSVQHTALLQRQMRFNALAAVEVGSLLGGLGAAICLAWYGAHHWALVTSGLVTAATTMIAVWLLCAWRPGPPVRGSGVRGMLAYGGNYTGFGILNYFGNNIDNILIGRYWGAESLGLYARAFQLLYLPIDQINAPLGSVAIPTLSRLADSPERYRQAYLRILDKLTMITLPGVAFMIVTSDWLIRFLLGDRWIAVARLFSILGYGALLLPVSNSTGWLFLTQNRTRDMMQWGLIDTPIRIAVIAACVPWGPEGLAAVTVVRLCIVLPILFWYIGRSGPVRASDFYRSLAVPLFAALCVLAVLSAYHRYDSGANLIRSLATAFLLAVGTTLVAFLVTDRGRAALLDFKATVSLLTGRNQTKT